MAAKRCPSCRSTNTFVSGGSNRRGWVVVTCNNCGNRWEVKI